MKILRLIPLAGIVMSCVLAGCGGGSSSGGGTPTGTLQVQVTDAPFPTNCFKEATVAISKIEIQPTGSQGDGGWVLVTATASTNPLTYNLLDLAGGVSQTAAIAQVPAGRYHKIRLHVDRAVLTWNEAPPETTRDFTIPSGRIDINPDPQIVIVPGQTTGLMLDFDLASSFVQTGPPAATCDELKQANKIIFTPVIRATNLDASGVVSGTVRAGATALAGATVSAVSGTATIASAISADGSSGGDVGAYALLLAPGTYDIVFEATGRPTQTVAGVTVEGAKVKKVDATFP